MTKWKKMEVLIDVLCNKSHTNPTTIHTHEPRKFSVFFSFFWLVNLIGNFYVFNAVNNQFFFAHVYGVELRQQNKERKKKPTEKRRNFLGVRHQREVSSKLKGNLNHMNNTTTEKRERKKKYNTAKEILRIHKMVCCCFSARVRSVFLLCLLAATVSGTHS